MDCSVLSNVEVMVEPCVPLVCSVAVAAVVTVALLDAVCDIVLAVVCRGVVEDFATVVVIIVEDETVEG